MALDKIDNYQIALAGDVAAQGRNPYSMNQMMIRRICFRFVRGMMPSR